MSHTPRRTGLGPRSGDLAGVAATVALSLLLCWPMIAGRDPSEREVNVLVSMRYCGGRTVPDNQRNWTATLALPAHVHFRALLGGPSPPEATAMNEVFWHKMTGPDVAEMAKLTDVAIVPLGCTEMHGPHLPTGCDGWCSEAICERAARLESAIVLPTLFYNVNERMMSYPGTIAITHETMRRLHHDICAECARNGFRKVIIFVGHGGSQDVVEIVQAEVLEWRARGRQVDYFPIWVFVTRVMEEEMRELIKTPAGHGCEFETSYAMACVPDLVHIDRVSPDEPGPHHAHKIERSTYRVPWLRNTPLGYIGEPWQATPEKGEAMLEAGARRLAEVVRQFKEFDPDRDP